MSGLPRNYQNVLGFSQPNALFKRLCILLGSHAFPQEDLGGWEGRGFGREDVRNCMISV